MKIPLAWLQLTHEKVRFLIALAGIGFADILMFMQLGFRDALFDSAIRLHSSLKGDVFLISPQSTSLISMKSFSQRRLYQALAVEGVEIATPLYISAGMFKNPDSKNTRGIFVLGFNPERNVINLPEIRDNLSVIKLQDMVLFDRKSRGEFGPIAEYFESGKTVTTEIQSRKITVGGLFALGTSFGADGNLITSDLNFFRIFPERQKGLVDIGVIQLKPDTDVNLIVKSLREKLPNDVKIFARDEFLKHEQNYWKTRTAIGFIFTLGTIMGFFVGMIIVYQILYTDVADHLPEYATLKAMGYTDFYLLTVVFQEAVILAIIGYLPGIFISNLLYGLTIKATGLPLFMTVSRATTILVLTIIMCCFSGVIAVNKLRAADPADIF
jgi:putative ABC transport system permease protein